MAYALGARFDRRDPRALRPERDVGRATVGRVAARGKARARILWAGPHDRAVVLATCARARATSRAREGATADHGGGPLGACGVSAAVAAPRSPRPPGRCRRRIDRRATDGRPRA